MLPEPPVNNTQLLFSCRCMYVFTFAAEVPCHNKNALWRIGGVRCMFSVSVSVIRMACDSDIAAK